MLHLRPPVRRVSVFVAELQEEGNERIEEVVKLIDLDPRWIHSNVFTFLCPCCMKWRLSCKNIPMGRNEQWELFDKVHGEYAYSKLVVGCKEDIAWNFPSGADFNTISVTPSIDASASGHWHGYITNGEIK